MIQELVTQKTSTNQVTHFSIQRKMLRCGIKRLFFLVFVFFIVAPLTLMVWRAIWGLLDEYITTINDEVNITSSTYHPSTGCHFNKTPSFDNQLQNIHPGEH